MKNIQRATTLGLLLACCLAAPVDAKERVLEQEFPPDGVDTVALSGGNGTVRITVGDRDVILVRVAVNPDKMKDKEPWEAIKKWFLTSAYEDMDDLIEAVRLDTDSGGGGKLSIGLKPPKRTRDSRVAEGWEITIPRRLAVRIAMDRADMRVSDVAGGVSISLGNGLAEVDVPGGDLDIDITVGKARIRTGSESVSKLSLRSQVGDTNLWMNGLKVKYPDPPGPGSRITFSGEGEDAIVVSVQVGDASLRVNEQ